MTQDSATMQGVCVATAPFETQVYKRWLTNEKALFFVLDASLLAYRIFRFDLTLNEFSEWDCNTGDLPAARTMPFRCIDINGVLTEEGTVFIPPTVRLSPNRSKACWLGRDDDWVVANADLTELSHHARDDYDGLSHGVMWFPDDNRWAEPIYSNTWKSFVEFDVHTFLGVEPTTCSVRNLRRGRCIGTSLNGEAVFVYQPGSGCYVGPEETEEVRLTRLNLNSDELAGIRRTVKVPVGYNKRDICLAPRKGMLAWNLWRRDGDIQSEAMWVTDTQGKELLPIMTIDRNWLESLEVSPKSEKTYLHDMEWLPDESGVSFMYANHVINYSLG